jgi:hypothetical protein
MKVTSRKLDVFGFATLSIAIGALQLFLDRGEVLDWFDSVEIRIEFFAAVIAFAFFLVHTLTTSNASFFNRELARDRNFVTGCALYFVMGAVLYATRALLPPLLQDLMQYSVIGTGLATTPSGAGSMIAMNACGATHRANQTAIAHCLRFGARRLLALADVALQPLHGRKCDRLVLLRAGTRPGSYHGPADDRSILNA